MDQTNGMTWPDFGRDWSLRLMALLELVAVAAVAWWFVPKVRENCTVYDLLIGASIMVNFFISLGYVVGTTVQGWNKPRCCLKSSVLMGAFLSALLTAWFVLFLVGSIGYLGNIYFAAATSAVYMVLDLLAFKISKDEHCGRLQKGLPADVRRSFWQIDFPTFIAITLFLCFCFWWLPGETKVLLNLTLAPHAAALQPEVAKKISNVFADVIVEGFAHGGLAFLMLESSLCFCLGFPQYVLPLRKWYDATICPRESEVAT